MIRDSACTSTTSAATTYEGLSATHLQELFSEFNSRYFAARLPEYTVQLVSHITRLREAGSINRAKKLIRISTHQSDAEMISTLLHEMAHAAVRGGHSGKWFSEMERMRAAGAQLSDSDMALLAKGPEEKLSRERLQGLADEALGEIPDATEWGIASWIVQRHDYANTPTSFFRKYKWAKSVLRACRMEHQVSARVATA